MTEVPGIRVRGAHHIDGRKLFDIDLTLPAGRWTCLLGASGVGKSTILRVILGLETGGHFAGDLSATDDLGLAGRISYMAQSDLLLPWLTVRENVMIGARLRGEVPDMARADALIGRVGLAAHADKRPSALSGGMRQRAALARTMMEDRPVVFLDEPFSALDAGTRADMQELAVDVLRGRTVLLVTHDPAEAARVGHQILVLSPGGAQAWSAPKSDIPRAIEDAEAIQCQTHLLAHLRGATGALS